MNTLTIKFWDKTGVFTFYKKGPSSRAANHFARYLNQKWLGRWEWGYLEDSNGAKVAYYHHTESGNILTKEEHTKAIQSEQQNALVLYRDGRPSATIYDTTEDKARAYFENNKKEVSRVQLYQGYGNPPIAIFT